MGLFWHKAKSPIALVVLLCLLFFGFWWGYKNVIKPIPEAPGAPCVTQSVGDNLKSSLVVVRVFNGGETRGLARKVATALEGKGFKVSRVANTPADPHKTRIVGADVNNPQVKLVAGFFNDATVEADGRVEGTVDVFVGSEFSGMNMQAPVSIAVGGQQVCLPVLDESKSPAATSSPSPTR